MNCGFDTKIKGVEPTAESLEAGAAYERMMLGCMISRASPMQSYC